MSTKLVNEEISSFLGRKEAEVLCIRGKWGVGKTFAFARQLEAAQKAKKIDRPRYSYVSLFGVNSLDELKLAIFENVITLSEGVKKADLETLDAFVTSKIGSWRKLTRIAQSLPLIKNVVGADATGLVSFMTIRDQVICIDDLERRGQKLDVNDVLGLISYLREQRNCKVVLILNDEQLGDGREAFNKNLEKVVDLSLVYQPSAAECAKIAIVEIDDISRFVAERCTTLGITNIRVIKRAVHFVEALKPLMSDYDNDVFNAAVGSVVLFSWSHDQPEDAPTLSFLKSKTQDKFGLRRKEDMPLNEASWNSLLEVYRYIWTDDFDVVLMEGVCDGYFDPDKVKKAAQVVHEKVIATKADGSFEAAWRRYHDSFSNDQDEVLDGIYTSFMTNYKYITPTNLSGTVSLFKELGRAAQAKEMLDHYMAHRNEDREFFDLGENIFGSHVTDQDVRAAFAEKAAQVEEKRDIPAIMLAIKDGWNDDQINALATAPIEEYRKAFKSRSGIELRRMLANVFQFDRIANASDGMKEISRRAREGLRLIGAESLINARRVNRFGVRMGQVEEKQ